MAELPKVQRAAARSEAGRQGYSDKIATLASEVGEEDIAALAYELWQSRGCPKGSPQEDWFRAVETLNSRQ
jgi:hypothetical protein